MFQSPGLTAVFTAVMGSFLHSDDGPGAADVTVCSQWLLLAVRAGPFVLEPK